MGRAPCCEKVGLKKGRWTQEEDDILSKYIQDNGEGSWRSLPKNAGLLRCGKSCRLRWVNYLRNDLKKGNISQQEDDIIIKLHASLGNKWSIIASKLIGRTDNEIKNYWNSHLSRKVDTLRTQRELLPIIMSNLDNRIAPSKKKGGRISRALMKKNKNNYTTTTMITKKVVNTVSLDKKVKDNGNIEKQCDNIGSLASTPSLERNTKEHNEINNPSHYPTLEEGMLVTSEVSETNGDEEMNSSDFMLHFDDNNEMFGLHDEELWNGLMSLHGDVNDNYSDQIFNATMSGEIGNNVDWEWECFTQENQEQDDLFLWLWQDDKNTFNGAKEAQNSGNCEMQDALIACFFS